MKIEQDQAIISFKGEITQQTAVRLVRSVQQSVAAGKRVVIMIASGGGATDSSLWAANNVRPFASSITTVNMAQCRSGAVFLFTAGSIRIAVPSSSFQLHAPRFNHDAKIEATIEWLTAKLDWLRVDLDASVRMIHGNTGMTVDKAKQLIQADTYLTAQQAVEVGIAGRVDEVTWEASHPIELITP